MLDKHQQRIMVNVIVIWEGHVRMKKVSVNEAIRGVIGGLDSETRVFGAHLVTSRWMSVGCTATRFSGWLPALIVHVLLCAITLNRNDST